MSESPAPRVHAKPERDRSDGDLAAQFATDYGLKPDQWQRLVLDDWLAMQGNVYAALTCSLAVPRQNGKNAVLEMRELFGVVGKGEKFLHTAHQVKTAQKHFKRLKWFFGESRDDPKARFPELNRLVTEVRNQNGMEGIFLANGGSIEIAARSKSSGRGFTVDVLVLDEAQELSDDSLEALTPTNSAAPSGNPQMIFTGTPPGPMAQGEVFTRVRAAGLAVSTQPGHRAHAEWSVRDVPIQELSLDDRTCWWQTNPALQSGRLLMTVVEEERTNLSDEGFARERLGWWSDGAIGKAVVSYTTWAGLRRSAPADGVVAYGVQFAHDGSRVCLAVAVKPSSGPVFLEVIEERSASHGTSWLVEWLVARHQKAAVIVIDGRAGRADLVNSLRAAGVPDRKILVPNVEDIEAAYAGWLVDVTETRVAHAGQPGLDDAVRCSVRRKIGVNGAWGIQATGDGDVVPLEAVVLARHGVTTTKRKPTTGKAGFS